MGIPFGSAGNTRRLGEAVGPKLRWQTLHRTNFARRDREYMRRKYRILAHSGHPGPHIPPTVQARHKNHQTQVELLQKWRLGRSQGFPRSFLSRRFHCLVGTPKPGRATTSFRTLTPFIWDCQVTTSKQCIIVAPRECTKGKMMREIDRVEDNRWHFRKGRQFIVCEVPKFSA